VTWLRLLLYSCLSIGMVSLSACTTTYSAKPMTATVVDAETGQPLESVNVVAQWILHGPTWRSAGSLEVDEAVTDKDGKFHIPGWGPKAIPDDLPRGTRLGNSDPALIFFKSGYRIRHLGNELQLNRLRPEDDTPVRSSDWDGKVIKLEKFKGTQQDYAGMLSLGSGFYYQDCKWVKFRRWLMAMFREADTLDALHVRNTIDNYRLFAVRNRTECGSLEKIFAEYLK